MKGPIALGTIRTSVVFGLRLLVQSATLLLVARLLGPREFGALAGVAALAVILGALSSFGMQLVLLGEVSKAPERRLIVLRSAIPCTLLCGGALLTVYLVSTIHLFGRVMPFHVLAMIGIAELLVQPLFALMTTEHHALGRIAGAQLLQLLPMLLRLLAAGLTLIVQPELPLDVYGAGYLLASVVALFCGACVLPGRWPKVDEWRLPDRGGWGEAFGYAVINITRAAPGELDKALSLKLLPLGAAGMYAAAARVVGAATLPVSAMMLSALPRLFREDRGSGPTRRLFIWMYACAFMYSLVLAAALWLAAPLLDVFFGVQYAGVGEIVRWLCLAVPGMAIRQVVGNSLMAFGERWMRVGFEMGGLVILGLAGVVLTQRFGALGLPLAVISAEWTMAVIGSVLVVRVVMPRRGMK
ncbi:lipopolysaccharide biosynthesis protein [Stenotrophomonas sp.]|uniref:lipopolysaccharide biosynthesis protein n=1 Tax=Stenotrophomonas sp. TaxID=69392 RepID=UPI0028A6CA4D|nr:lipopolysaccharide biosynthesis protein [Stenotrophomonas sp.]